MLVVLTNGLESLLLRKGLHAGIGFSALVVVLLSSPGLFVCRDRRLPLNDLVIDVRSQSLFGVNVDLRIGCPALVRDVLDNELRDAVVALDFDSVLVQVDPELPLY